MTDSAKRKLSKLVSINRDLIGDDKIEHFTRIVDWAKFTSKEDLYKLAERCGFGIATNMRIIPNQETNEYVSSL